MALLSSRASHAAGSCSLPGTLPARRSKHASMARSDPSFPSCATIRLPKCCSRRAGWASHRALMALRTARGSAASKGLRLRPRCPLRLRLLPRLLPLLLLLAVRSLLLRRGCPLELLAGWVSAAGPSRSSLPAGPMPGLCRRSTPASAVTASAAAATAMVLSCTPPLLCASPAAPSDSSSTCS